MADEILRSIYSAADETVAQLDQLHRASRESVLTNRQALEAAVGRLGDSSVPWAEPDGNVYGAQERLSEPTRPPTRPEETPYFPLPERTTHGGRFGPAVRAKLLAEALAKDSRWR